MGASRSPIEFMQRLGLTAESRQPAPRLCPQDLLVNFVPVEDTNLDPGLLSQFEGDPAPDRAVTKPWPSVTDEQ